MTNKQDKSDSAFDNPKGFNSRVNTSALRFIKKHSDISVHAQEYINKFFASDILLLQEQVDKLKDSSSDK